MSQLIAVDIAILPPPDVAERAIALSATLPADHAERFVLDAEHRPHLTLTQAFIRAEEADAAFDRVDEVLRGQRALTLPVTGGGKSGHSVWMAVERTNDLVALHEAVMEALRGYERPGGTPAAFIDGDARVADVLWVTGYRLKSSFGAFTPHITLGHGDAAPEIEAFTFEADTVAVCHLGRFCTCRAVLRVWELSAPAAQ
jgi:2'-5' RNA ligase